MDFDAEYEALRSKIEKRLEGYFTGECTQKLLLDAMRYSLLAGGKRVRPILVLKFCEAAGGDTEAALPLACAVEMLHTYSLIHDDMPVMDNDDLRRGKPTCHKVYGECTAMLAGDALQAAAFRAALGSGLPADVRADAAMILAEAAGEGGMCGGQLLDTVDASPRTQAFLSQINDLKTGALLRAACLMGVAAAGAKATAMQRLAASEYGIYLARAFQIRDDVLDMTSTDEALGKNAGSDARCGKVTYASLLGEEACNELVRDCTDRAREALRSGFGESEFLDTFAARLEERTR